MVETERGRPQAPGLLAWSLGAFHTALFVAILIALTYRDGTLGNLLAGLSTELGFAIYAALWLSVWWCTRRALQDSSESWSSGRVNLEVIGHGAYRGAAAGGLFVVSLVALVIVRWLVVLIVLVVLAIYPHLPSRWRDHLANLIDGIAIGAGIILIGIPLGIGGAIGLVLAIVDSLLLAVSSHLLQMAIAEPVPDNMQSGATSGEQ